MRATLLPEVHYAPSAPALYVDGGPEGPTFADNFNCADAGDLGAA